MDITWDEEKAEINLAKHGIAFEEAATVLMSESAVHFDDDDHDEPRTRTIGYSYKARMLYVVNAECSRDHGTIRIISARKAIKSERRRYEQERKGHW